MAAPASASASTTSTAPADGPLTAVLAPPTVAPAAPPIPVPPGTWLVRWADHLLVGSFLLLLFLLPFSKATIEVTSVLMLIGWLIHHGDPTTRWQTAWADRSLWAPGIAGALFFAACALSIPTSTFPDKSLEALIGKWGQYLGLALVAADLGKRPRLMHVAMAVLALSSGLVAFDGFWQEHHRTTFFPPYHRFDYFGRMTGPYENPIDLATYLMVIIPLLLGWSSHLRASWKVPVGILIAALMVCLGRTHAAGAWLGFTGGMVLMALCRPTRRVALVALSCWLLLGGVSLTRGAGYRELLSPSEIGKQDRLAMWRSAVAMIKDRPLVGQGLNTFMANYLRFWVGGERQPRYAHNCYLQMAAETGLIGLAAFLGWLAAVGWRLIRGIRRQIDLPQALLAGCLVGLAAFAAQSAIDTNFYSLRQVALFFTVAGLGLGLCVAPRPAAVDAARTPRP